MARGGIGVDALTAEVGVVADQVYRNARSGQRRTMNIERERLEAKNRLESKFLKIDGAISRNDDVDREPQLFQFRREGAQDVGKAADCSEGHILTGQHDDVHVVLL